MKDKLNLRFKKNVDSTKNKMVIPKFFIDKWGKSFMMEVDNVNGKITLYPINALKEGE